MFFLISSGIFTESFGYSVFFSVPLRQLLIKNLIK